MDGKLVYCWKSSKYRTTHAINLFKMEQKEDWFVKISPNGRIPALGALVLRILQCLTQPH